MAKKTKASAETAAAAVAQIGHNGPPAPVKLTADTIRKTDKLAMNDTAGRLENIALIKELYEDNAYDADALDMVKDQYILTGVGCAIEFETNGKRPTTPHARKVGREVWALKGLNKDTKDKLKKGILGTADVRTQYQQTVFDRVVGQWSRLRKAADLPLLKGVNKGKTPTQVAEEAAAKREEAAKAKAKEEAAAKKEAQASGSDNVEVLDPTAKENPRLEQAIPKAKNQYEAAAFIQSEARRMLAFVEHNPEATSDLVRNMVRDFGKMALALPTKMQKAAGDE